MKVQVMKEKINDRIWQLLARRTAGEMLPEEAEELDRLMQEHPDASFVAEVLQYGWSDKFRPYGKPEAERLMAQHKERLAAAEALKERAVDGIELAIEKSNTVRWLWYSGVAAAVVLAFFATWKFAFQHKHHQDTDTVHFAKATSTPKGKKTRLNLPDGSTVWLNASSTLEYENTFSGTTRNVRLSGEAYFEIAKDSNRPFFVHTNAFKLRVLGTGFNVRAYPDEDSATASLVHGSVEVIAAVSEERIMLKPNEQVILPSGAAEKKGVSTTANLVSEIGTAVQSRSMMTTIQDSILVETAWKNNTIAFKKMPLERVAVMLENWFNVVIRFRKVERKTLLFTGVFKGESLNGILETLEATGSFHYTMDKEGIIWIE